ncbi:transmembrane protein 204 [Petromyzon marinus]|uniref:Transmembrane protein 204 n=1 Tax=Petromyzon marinus TaxID=7757 RepID=A0AAJ7TXF6_PETMA|nr:transmembrane protein 204 [Petromyzon marinus]
MVLNAKLVALAVAVALVSLVLNNVAAFTANWVYQSLEEGRRRSVGLWRMCYAGTEGSGGAPAQGGEAPGERQEQRGPSVPCVNLGWGSDPAGYLESHATVKLQFDMMRGCNLIASAALFLGLLLYVITWARSPCLNPNTDWWEEAMAGTFQLACFVLVIGLATFFRVGPYTQLAWSCYVEVVACLLATAAAAMIIWDVMQLPDECLPPRQNIIIRHPLPSPCPPRPNFQNEYVETPC